MSTAEQIGHELKKLRIAKGYSLEELGKLVGKSRKTIHAYETGVISMSVETLKAILDVYGESTGKFLDNIE